LQNLPTHQLHTAYLSKAKRNVEASLRGAMIRRLQQLSIAFHKETPSGKLQSKIMRDVENFEAMSTQIFTTVLNVVSCMLITLVIVLIKNIYVFLMFLVCVPVVVLIMQAFRKPIRKHNQEFRHSMENTSSDVMNMIELIPVTRAHALEKKEIKKLTGTMIDAAEKGYNLDIITNFFGTVSYIFFSLVQVLCLAFTAYLAYKGSIVNIGDIALFQSYFTALLGYVSSITALMPIISKGGESISSMGEILTSANLEATANKPRVEDLEGSYEFKNVSFEYDDDTPVLDGLTLNIEKGQTIAFVGESGSGKSTIINLITGFYKPTQGCLLVDGKDITEINLRSYRRFISVVPQKTILFSGTVRDNITYGNPRVSEEELKFVIKAAQLESVIEKLPFGLDTDVGEHGDKLSGGQKQRISIARAIIRNPKVIIFDEATSALDSASEKEIQKAIDYLTADRTTFIVAHRLSTIRNADKIAVIDGGKCVEYGSYDELMAKKGAFYKLQSLQQA
ncbi:MAG: ABC transporter ATP-binding protein, partial [Clostridia bacterium]|nr:ABC transporter ATP-binding protein [Clostridia bacterium]